ncbi:hypothetical protein FIE12Z_1511 [Fusarium flagelliforme]|uniref:Nucleoside phosphorylase domain-containing protein n=1 Tax=Fusarium flagelliforme TaxID=2675880 RepID=A0A395N2P7_9HYPO|nr:hypothetical protein FIE12Z_1511 [Fusarium flagelliforme]
MNSSFGAKRPRAFSQASASNLQHDDYTVAWISALPLEMTAAEVMLDSIHRPLPHHPQDSNCYTLGSINGHNVVIACLPKGQYGTNNAATVASHLARSFLNIQHHLMVGIGGGAPCNADVRLGDVVVSTEVLQYDLGKALPDNQFQRIAYPVRPSQSLMTGVSKLQASHSRGAGQFSKIVSNSAATLPHYAHPNVQDRLFRSAYSHPSTSKSCDDCDQTELVPRDARQGTDPVIHFGRIASGNQVIKDAQARNRLSKELGCICFEMEAAGLVDSSPYLAVRGICDYSDSHKNKKWQDYAALTAAAYAKDLLLTMPAHGPPPSKRRKIHEPEALDREVTECLKALFVTDPAQDREDILDAKGQICEGTCEWVLSTEEFQTWDQKSPHLLWVSAPPGVGKTFLSIFLSKHFELVSSEQSDTATIFFFCDNKIETRNTTVNILRGLLYQLATLETGLTPLMLAWEHKSSSLFEENSFGVLWRVFQDMIEKSSFRTIYCVVDALDECEHDSLNLLLTKFEQLSNSVNGTTSKVKLVCLSRRFPERIPESLDLFIKIELDMMPAGKADVERFIAQRVSTLSRKKKFGPKMETRIQEVFQNKSEGTFLWVSFMAQDLENKNLLEIEASLDSLPAGLDAIYDRILSEIDLTKRNTIDKMLDWILVATRPLRIPELCDAASIESTELLTCEEVCLELIKSCGHLLQILKGESLFESLEPLNMLEAMPEKVETIFESFWSQSVTFLHQSAKDYFTTTKRQTDGATEHSKSLSKLHEWAASELIQYFHEINHHYEMALGGLSKLLTELPLTLYATRNWHLHFQEIPNIGHIILQNEDFFSPVSKTRGAYETVVRTIDADFHNYVSGTSTLNVPILHLSCILNLPSLVQWYVRNGQTSDLSVRGGFKRYTPLHIAIHRNNERIIDILLDAGADILVKEGRKRNAFVQALGYCNANVLRQICQRDQFKEWITDETLDSQTSFIGEAIWMGNEEACHFLVDEFAWDPGFPSDGEPLYLALQDGLFDLARKFAIKWHVHVDSWRALEAILRCNYGFEDGLRSVVQDYSIDINTTNGLGQNACMRALMFSRAPVSKLQTLLQFGCNPDHADEEGRRPLHYCALEGISRCPEGFTRVVGLLLSHECVQVNQTCHEGRTVLHHLMKFFWFDLAHYRNVTLDEMPQCVISLLDRGVDRHIKDMNDLSALHILESCLDRDTGRVEESEWLEYVEVVKETILVLQDYCTVPSMGRALEESEGEPCQCTTCETHDC